MKSLRYIVGVPKEKKTKEGRVGLTPHSVHAIVTHGGSVLIEKGAGLISGFSDKDYEVVGAHIVPDPTTLWSSVDIVVKVKEPTPEEYQYLPLFKNKTLFGYLHLAGSDRRLTELLLENDITAIASEMVAEIGPHGKTVYPLLAPMSHIAGDQAMLGGLLRYKPEDHPSLVTLIIGGGNVGEAAIKRALAHNVGHVIVLESWMERVNELSAKYSITNPVSVLPLGMLDGHLGETLLKRADVIISAPMLPGGKGAPIVLTAKHFAQMKQGAYIADVSIDQGGSTEWTKGNPTKPGEVFIRGERNLVFSATPNIPGSTVPREATLALNDAALPYILHMVKHRLWTPIAGTYAALKDSVPLRKGLQTWRGALTNPNIAAQHGVFKAYYPLDRLFSD